MPPLAHTHPPSRGSAARVGRGDCGGVKSAERFVAAAAVDAATSRGAVRPTWPRGHGSRERRSIALLGGCSGGGRGSVSTRRCHPHSKPSTHQASRRAQDVDERLALRVQRIEHRRARWDDRRLEKVGQEALARVQSHAIAHGGAEPTDGYARREFCQEDQVEEERDGKEAVLARRVDGHGELAIHRDAVGG